jgi:hypothetical protein
VFDNSDLVIHDYSLARLPWSAATCRSFSTLNGS